MPRNVIDLAGAVRRERVVRHRLQLARPSASRSNLNARLGRRLCGGELGSRWAPRDPTVAARRTELDVAKQPIVSVQPAMHRAGQRRVKARHALFNRSAHSLPLVPRRTGPSRPGLDQLAHYSHHRRCIGRGTGGQDSDRGGPRMRSRSSTMPPICRRTTARRSPARRFGLLFGRLGRARQTIQMCNEVLDLLAHSLGSLQVVPTLPTAGRPRRAGPSDRLRWAFDTSRTGRASCA